ILYKYLNKFYLIYINNMLIYINKNINKYYKYIQKILQKLRKAGLFLNIKKYKFK
ncbi:uncharacterized protein BO72DRAFT_384799, partial [Aspergillus fijiensis CBS 313.89]